MESDLHLIREQRPMALLIIDRALKIGKSTVDGGKREMTKF